MIHYVFIEESVMAMPCKQIRIVHFIAIQTLRMLIRDNLIRLAKKVQNYNPPRLIYNSIGFASNFKKVISIAEIKTKSKN